MKLSSTLCWVLATSALYAGATADSNNNDGLSSPALRLHPRQNILSSLANVILGADDTPTDAQTPTTPTSATRTTQTSTTTRTTRTSRTQTTATSDKPTTTDDDDVTTTSVVTVTSTRRTTTPTRNTNSGTSTSRMPTGTDSTPTDPSPSPTRTSSVVIVTLTRPGITTTATAAPLPTIDKANGEKADVGTSSNITTIIVAPTVTSCGLLFVAVVFYFFRRSAMRSKYGDDDIFGQPHNYSPDPFLPTAYHDNPEAHYKDYPADHPKNYPNSYQLN
ncbi:hypothetical protein GGI12_000271 [Dipsacomyces acuminosporus]|nr:hypothetical protein GGI12_000271 [Dipsacomyces acuminosporus]